MSQGTAPDDARLAKVIDQQEIRDVIYRYCRGIDRRDFDMVRSCYHPDAFDDHGDFRGGVDDFIAYVQNTIVRYERTMHFIGNMFIEPRGDTARVESYIIAFHRMRQSSTKPARDFSVWLRYVDDFERRNGEWRVAARVCAFEWSRIDAVAPGGWTPPPTAALGIFGDGDVVFAPTIAGWTAPGRPS